MRRARFACGEGGGSVTDGDGTGAAGLLTGVRAARADDAASIAAIYAPHVTHGAASFETTPPDAAAIARRIAAAGERYPWLVAVEGDDVLGYAYAGAFGERDGYRWSVETTVYIADRAQRRGIARALYARLIELLTAQGYAQVVARIALPNAGSVALHEALGFVRVGAFPAIGYKHGRWIDVGLWQRALATPGDPPAEPLPLGAIGG